MALSRRLPAIVLLLGGAPLWAALGPRYGGELTIAVASLPALGDPSSAPGLAERTVGAMVHETLVRVEAGGTPSPALARMWSAAADARDEGADILIMARTDARATLGLDEALSRAYGFVEAGADVVFVEAPESEAEMARVCAEVPGHHLANMVEGGRTPVLPPDRLAGLGFKIAAYPLTLLSAAARAMRDALSELAAGRKPDPLLDFAELQRLVGFPEYDAEARRYSDT